MVVDFLEFQSFYGVLLAHNSLYDEGNRFAYVVVGDFSGYYVVRMTIFGIASAMYHHIKPFHRSTAEFHDCQIITAIPFVFIDNCGNRAFFLAGLYFCPADCPAFRLLKQYGVPVSVAMCIHRENRNSLRATANYLANYGVYALKLNAPQELGEWKQYSEQYALAEDEVWEIYREYIDDYFEDGMPIDIDLDGYFHCEKGRTDYKIPYSGKVSPGMEWNKCPYCESVRFSLHIGPDGRCVPCMGFYDTALKEKFPNILEVGLADATTEGFCYDVVNTMVSDLLAKNPECAECEHLECCHGGCMVQDITDEGDYLVPDKRCCYFHKHIGEAAVRETADNAIALYVNPSERAGASAAEDNKSAKYCP